MSVSWHLYGPTFGPEESAAVAAVLRSGQLSVGTVSEQFERRCGEFLGAPEAVAVSSGTAALHLTLLALDLEPGDEVVMPSLTFVAGASMTRLLGGRPVFADITGPHDLTIDVDHVASLIGPRTRAVLTMHYGGYPADLERLREVCDERSVALVEDSAHAFAVKTPKGTCGTVGEFGTFSFFATKNVSVGEGGLVVARSSHALARVRRLRSHALTATPQERAARGVLQYDVTEFGLNYRPSELSSAIGLAQLDRLTAKQRDRERVCERYRAALTTVDGVEVPFAGRATGAGAHHLMVVLLPSGTDRNAVRSYLEKAGVQTGMHYPPTHLFTAYRQERGGEAVPKTEAVAARLLSLPMHPGLSNDDVDQIVGHLAASIADLSRG